MERPLRVVEVSTAVTAAYASMILGDLGCDVIKVEPIEGDRSRRWPPLLPDSGYFESLNRNKRSINLDLKSEVGREVLDRLLGQADVLICNYRPKARAKLGLDPETVHARHPHLVYATIHGSGSNGPRSDEGSTDVFAQAATGLMSITGSDPDKIAKIPMPIADLVAGLYAVIGIFHELRSGQGQRPARHIEVTLEDSALSLLLYFLSDYSQTGVIPRPAGTTHPNITPYETYRAADRDIAVIVFNDAAWVRACAAIGREDLAKDPRLATVAKRRENRAEVTEAFAAAIREHPAEYWLKHLRLADIPCALVRNIAEVVNDPEYRERGSIVDVDMASGQRIAVATSPVTLDGERLGIRMTAPRLGAHTEQILADLGYSLQERQEIQRSGAAGGA